MNITVPGNITCDNTVLCKLQDELLAHVRSLEALGVTGEQSGVILTPLILSRLPQDVRLEWAREGQGRESDLDWLLMFLARCSNRVRFLLEIHEVRHRKKHRGSSGPRERIWVGSVWQSG